MTREEVIQGLQFTIEMFLFDPSTGETLTEPRNNLDKATIDACKGAIELLKQQPCEDCISREEALKVMCDSCPMYNCVTGCSSYRHIEKMPSVTPQPKRGKWEVIRKEYEFMGSVVNEPQGCKCSNCGGIVRLKSDFCPSCGSYNGGNKG